MNRTIITLLLLALPATAIATQTPDTLWQAVEIQLDGGQLDRAGSTLQQLRRTVADTPGWDPDGFYSNEVIPRLERRLRDLTTTRQALIDASALKMTEIPEPVFSNQVTAAFLYSGWVRDSLVQLSQLQNDLLETRLGKGRNTGAILQDPEYNRAVSAAQSRIIDSALTALDNLIDELIESDTRSQILRTRLENVQRNLLDHVADKEAAEAELDQALETLDLLLEALGSSRGFRKIEPGTDTDQMVRDVGALLERELEDIISDKSHTIDERLEHLRRLDYLRFMGHYLQSSGIASNLPERLELLENTLDQIPVFDRERPIQSLPSWPAALLLVAVGAGGTAFLMQRKRPT